VPPNGVGHEDGAGTVMAGHQRDPLAPRDRWIDGPELGLVEVVTAVLRPRARQGSGRGAKVRLALERLNRPLHAFDDGVDGIADRLVVDEMHASEERHDDERDAVAPSDRRPAARNPDGDRDGLGRTTNGRRRGRRGGVLQANHVVVHNVAIGPGGAALQWLQSMSAANKARTTRSGTPSTAPGSSVEPP